MSEEDIIEKLIEMHLNNTTSPHLLYLAESFYFNASHPDYAHHKELQKRLYELAEERRVPWIQDEIQRKAVLAHNTADASRQ